MTPRKWVYVAPAPAIWRGHVSLDKCPVEKETP
jgi:hypothetical protein